jgi:protein O-GlcNAc transferase
VSDPRVEGQSVADLLQAALRLIHASQLPQADALCREVLAREPRNFNALQLLGHVALQRADYLVAVQWLSAARTVNGASAPLHSNLAVALLALRRPGEALAHCDAALALNPRLPEALCNRGHALSALKRTEDGLRCYEQCLEVSAGFHDALEGRTQALLRLNRLNEALASADRALAVAPSPQAWSLRGTVLLKAKRAAEALAAFDRALALAPQSPEYHNNRGTALRELKRPSEALQAYETAVRLRPAFAGVWCNVANLSLDAGKYEEAIGRCDEALRIQPGFLEALNIRGTALRVLKRYGEAAVTYERILSVEPHYGQTQSHLLAVRASLCDWTGYGELASSIVARVNAGVNASAPHAFLWVCGSAESQLRCARRFSADEFPKAAPQWRGERYRHERLRIAYVRGFYRSPRRPSHCRCAGAS